MSAGILCVTAVWSTSFIHSFTSTETEDIWLAELEAAAASSEVISASCIEFFPKITESGNAWLESNQSFVSSARFFHNLFSNACKNDLSTYESYTKLGNALLSLEFTECVVLDAIESADQPEYETLDSLRQAIINFQSYNAISEKSYKQSTRKRFRDWSRNIIRSGIRFGFLADEDLPESSIFLAGDNAVQFNRGVIQILRSLYPRTKGLMASRKDLDESSTPENYRNFLLVIMLNGFVEIKNEIWK
jgi:hypothetical protein